MVKVFAKRYWGFDPSRWPIISFGLEANRDALIRESAPGDLIAFVGTQAAPTAPEDQGRFLGLAEIGRIPVDSLRVLDPQHLNEHDYDANGQFKWPKAMAMVRAWHFVDKPRVTEVLQQQLTYDATVRAVLLDDRDRDAVLGLRMSEAELPDTQVLRQLRALSDTLSRTGPTTGPVPTNWTGTVTHNANAPAKTYAFRFGARNVWKIGHAQDISVRLAEVNQHVPHEVLNERWALFANQAWATQLAAYEMEQRVFARLLKRRTDGERIMCTEDELWSAWTAAMVPS